MRQNRLRQPVLRRISAALLSLVLFLPLCACGAAQKSDAEVNAKTAARGSYRAADEAYIETPMEAEMAYDADYGGFAAAEEAAMPMPAPAEAGGADTAAEAPAMPATAKSLLADDEAEPVEMPEPNDKRFCHVCGAELTEDVPFCPACGTRVAD